MTQYLKIPKERIGAIIGPKGETKKFIEDKTACQLDIDSDSGKIDITCGEDPLKEFRILETLKAIGRGFSPEKALGILEDDMLMLEIIDLSDVATTPKELQRVKGRIIGRGGRTRELAESLINVKISVYGKTVSILGYPEQNTIIRTAIKMLLDGATHGAVYKFLEKKHQELLHSQLDSIEYY
ncbi:RNA-processing protein [Methanosarcina sp. 2.H.T.1A.6]|jgi:ribosomal RNA assembly protein|uniref:KH domain-containing protein n=1 Tax=unclassified Methanosarcina TaxID=2644672 RepID=UPI0006227A50|nr:MULTISPECIES: KH domain-containing protein [unclassified Methanosarcina]KKG07617.1 RNA-processing protein [Methanosarcina sp. 2.H.A.1B.4]KKG14561.1 RNA-processing protein [Methanosarcina sp. 2.H.T.1A.15]KKG18884.1 RNA-processing protein [Methanosarcina sp. 2.H.T.1A.3]KKG24892.1 RNA-processing protein [Methanosarcina sp. 2.H.T.1A.6]KKG25989.1 RNA-processing protein [Methanosarcina sp. 2.H.T.1A.8]